MTKRDYERIAAAIKNLELIAEPNRERIAEMFCSLAIEDNPNFHRATFLRACGVPTDVEREQSPPPNEVYVKLRTHWYSEADDAIGDLGSNDDEHELLLEVMDAWPEELKVETP